MTMAHAGRPPKPEREFCQLPITALAFYQPPALEDEARSEDGDGLYVLAAEDTDLAVYAAVSRRPVFRLRAVLADEPIHGIQAAPGAAAVLVWGADAVALVSVEGLARPGEKRPLAVVACTRAPDWVYDAALSPHDPSSGVLVTAHNEVLGVKHRAGSSDIVLSAPASPARTMLFCARLAWDESPHRVLVAAGTAFGEILVWRRHLSGDDDDAPDQVLYVFTGHEGSIFDLDISPPVRLRDGSAARLLASCSDDRTVRVWDVAERGGGGGVRVKGPRDTGFRAGTGGEEARPAGLVAVNMGHVSRIWGVRFAVDEGDLSVYSFGEDATAQKWRLDMDAPGARPDPLTGRLSPERLFSAHDGKHIWSKALVNQGGKRLLATGGADGRISLIEESSGSSTAAHIEQGTMAAPAGEISTLSVADVLALLKAPQIVRPGREIFSRYAFTSEDELLATTSLGRVLLGTFQDEAVTWREVSVTEEDSNEAKVSYQVERVGGGAAVLGSTSGNIYFYHRARGIAHATKLPGKVVAVFCLSDVLQDVGSATEVEVLVFLLGSSVGHRVTFDPLTGSLRTYDQMTCLDSRFVPVSAAKIGDLLLVGSRHGFLSILKLEGDAYRPGLDVATRTRDAISCIVPLPPGPESSTSSMYFLATSRDGMYRIYEIRDQGTSLHLQLHHEALPPVGPLIAGAWFTGDASPELVIYGFRSKNLVVWNETRREELAAVECGGGPHRVFSLTSGAADPGRLRFAFAKALALCLYSQRAARLRSLKPGTHGREIRALGFNGRHLATGAEDTSVRLWERPPRGAGGGEEQELRCVAYVKAHSTGIQRLQWLGEDYLFSSGGNGEFFAWRVRRLGAGYAGLAVTREGVLGDRSVDGDLRVVDFDVSRDGDGVVLVTMAFSNSALKTYRYGPDGGFELAAEARYTGACLTQVRHVDTGEGEPGLLTASTDGHVALWATEAGEGGMRRHVLEQVEALHQSSIKSLDVQREGNNYRVLTGGDDNALGTAWVARDSPEGYNDNGDDTRRRQYGIRGRGIVRRAHAAAINGVVLRQARDGADGAVGVSVSNDQRIRVWRLGTRDGAGGTALLRDVYSGVADPGDVCLIDGGRRVVLGGVGVEMWRLFD